MTLSIHGTIKPPDARTPGCGAVRDPTWIVPDFAWDSRGGSSFLLSSVKALNLEKKKCIILTEIDRQTELAKQNPRNRAGLKGGAALSKRAARSPVAG